jgi:HlyD family secretion protein
MNVHLKPKLDVVTHAEVNPEPAQPARPFPWPRWLILAALAAAVVVGVYRWITTVPEVTVGSATTSELWTSFTAEGVVRAKEYNLSSESGGRVGELLVREGEAVTKGQLLVRLNSDQPESAIQEAQAAYATALQAVDQAREERALISRRQGANLDAAQTAVQQAKLQYQQVQSGARPEEITQAQQMVAKARAALTEAEQSYRRADDLYRQGAIARANLERAEAAYRAAQADLRQAEANEKLVKAGPSKEQLAVAKGAVALAEADLRRVQTEGGQVLVADKAVQGALSRVEQARAGLQRARTVLQEQKIMAPADGTVTRLIVEVGSVLVPGTPALLLSSREDLRVEAEISTEDVSKLSSGMEVDVTAAAYPGRAFKAEVVSLMPVGELKADAAIRTRIVRARVRLLEEPQLFRPGMEVDVEGRASLGQALTVPTDAVRYTGNQASVYVVRGGRIEEMPVEIGLQSADKTEVLSGLDAGQTVVLRGKDEVKPGDKVKVVQP